MAINYIIGQYSSKTNLSLELQMLNIYLLHIVKKENRNKKQIIKKCLILHLRYFKMCLWVEIIYSIY